MSAQAYTWGPNRPESEGRRQPGTVVEGPWPAVEEIRGEFEHAVMIDRAVLESAAPLRAVRGRTRSGMREGFSRGPIAEWVWSAAATAVMALLATGVVVALQQLVLVWQGQLS